MSFEAYSVAIRLKLIDGVSSGLLGMASQFATLNRRVLASQGQLRAFEAQLKSLKSTAMVGGALLGVGVAGLVALEAPLKAAREYELAFTKFKTLNLGDAVNAQANQFARSANIMGVSAKQLMSTMSESVGIFGSYAEAQKYVPQLAALNAANSLIFHGKIAGIDEGATRALMKFMDRRGLTRDEAGFNRGLNVAERLVTGSGGFIQFRDLANFSQMGGTAFRSLSDNGLINMALLLQEQGGSRAGQSMMSIYQNLVAGRTPKKTMNLLAEYGLGSLGMANVGTVGGKQSLGLVMSSVKDSMLLQADPVSWFRTAFLPALAAHGVTSEAAILKVTNDLLSNRNASNQASIMTTQLLQIARDANLTRNAMGVDQVIGAYKKNPDAQWENLGSSYTNLMVELGEAALPLVTKVVHAGTMLIHGLTDFARAFPLVTKGLVGAFVGLAGLTIAGGAVTLITAGFKGLGLALQIGQAAGIGGMLMDVAKGLGVFAARLGAVGAVAGISYGVGTWVNSWGPGGDLGGYLGGKLFEGTDPYDPNRKPTESRFVAGGKGGGVTVHTRVDLDGKKITDVVSKYQGIALRAPQTGPTAFDGRLSLAPAGGVGTY